MSKRVNFGGNGSLVRVGVVSAVLIMVVAGIMTVFAGIPGDDGRIHGCYLTHQNELERQGNLRVVGDASQCKDSETAISWNQQGLPGPSGAQGPRGDPGPAAPPEVLCDLERRILSAVPGFELSPACKGHIVFHSNRHGNEQIYVMDAVDADANGNGDNLTRLTFNVEAQGIWSTDGSMIAFVSHRDSNLEIYVMNANGTNQTRLTNNPAEDGAWGHAGLSPDGSKIAFASNRDGNQEIYVIDAVDADADGNGDNPTRLTNNAAADGYPTWSPDGSKIAFHSWRDGNGKIYVMDAVDADADGNGDNLTRLTNNPAGGADWSPDGSRILFSSTLDGVSGIYIMNADDGSNQTHVPNTFASEGGAWCPDGLRIVLVSEVDANREIYVINADGSNRTRLTTNIALDDDPDCSL